MLPQPWHRKVRWRLHRLRRRRTRRLPQTIRLPITTMSRRQTAIRFAARSRAMRKSTDSETLAAFEEVARYDVSTCSDTPIVIFGHGSAGNDATCEDPAISANVTFTLGKFIVAAIQAVGAIVRRAH